MLTYKKIAILLEGSKIMTFIRFLFIAIPLLFLAVAVIYAVFKIKEMKRNTNQQKARDDKSDLTRNGLKSMADYDMRRRNLYFPN